MSRRAAFLSSITAAVVAAAITAGALLLIGDGDVPPSSGNAATIQNDLLAPESARAQPSAPIPEPVSFAELSRSSVDWAAVYARVVPSLVSVITEQGAGSGFFVTSDGHVITNFHVVTGSEQIFVQLQDRRRFVAELVAKDAGNDLALLKIDAGDLEIVVPLFGGVDDLRVGDPVGALGAPFNLPNSLTVGIISALDRQRPSGGGTWQQMRAMIQTDAALNPGNSGGMLIDERGRVIGIPTQIESPDRASSGIGFAVSSDTLLRALPTLLEGKDFEQSFLGVTFQQAATGLEIRDVSCGSAADEANVRAGDRLLQINGESADTLDELVEVLSEITPGEEITITVQRGFRRLTLDATITGWPTERPDLGCG